MAISAGNKLEKKRASFVAVSDRCIAAALVADVTVVNLALTSDTRLCSMGCLVA